MCAVLVMNTDTKGKGMRIIQLPIIVPHVVVALFVVNILSQNGLLARLLCAMGLIKEQQDFVQLLYSTEWCRSHYCIFVERDSVCDLFCHCTDGQY